MAKRVFFAFDYRDVEDFRANVVRQHHTLKGGEAGYLDASLWEEAKSKGDDAIKKVIDDGLDRTTATVVLIGSNTFDRQWVRYEIAKSLQRGNLLVGIQINSIKGKDQRTKPLGRDPFDFVAYCFSGDGKHVTIQEWRNQWISFNHLAGWTLGTSVSDAWKNKCLKTSQRATLHDWVLDDGYNNFANWIGE